MIIVQDRYKHNINICLPSYNKVFGKMNVLQNGIKLCQTLNINTDNFCSLKCFKSYVKSIDLTVI